MDVDKIEAVEKALDEFINARSRQKKEANAEEELWRASERRVREKRRRANRQAWIDHHGYMNRLHLGLANEHADKRSRLMLETQNLDEGAGVRTLMVLCAGTKRNGEGCTATVGPPQRYCWWHDPANADERRRAASRGGRGKPNRELRNLKKQLEDLAADVLRGRVERSNAAVVNQILNTCARLIELERKIREQDELLERLDSLERSAEANGQGRRGPWGA